MEQDSNAHSFLSSIFPVANSNWVIVRTEPIRYGQKSSCVGFPFEMGSQKYSYANGVNFQALLGRDVETSGPKPAENWRLGEFCRNYRREILPNRMT
jgi:hypothetical protein